MKEFVFIFRINSDLNTKPSPEQMQERMNWLGSVAAQNKLADKGNRLSVANAKTVRSNNVVSEGPYSDIKEFVTGYMVVKTATVEEAIEIARANPILKGGGNIEIRPVLTPEDNA